MHIRKIFPNSKWHNKHCSHPYHELVVVISGIMHVTGENQKFELHPGDAALYPAGVKHWEYSDANEPVENCFIVFEDSNFTGDRIFVNREQGVLLRAMSSAFYEFSMFGELALFGDDYLKMMLKIFFANMPENETKSNVVQRVHSFIRKNMANHITLSDLAQVAGLSKYHFLRQYQLECGKTPVRALWEMRCIEAVSLLKYTNLPIKEIAFRTGFSDIKHFSRRIKAFSGKVPGKIRSL